jgi:GH18 family chitinase
MCRDQHLAISLAASVLFLLVPAEAQGPSVVGSSGWWPTTGTGAGRRLSYSHKQIPFQKLTQINHAGLSFNSDGTLSVPDGFLERELISEAHAAGVKVLLLVGGPFMSLEAHNGRDLAGWFADVHRGNGYDGVDVDWEYPSSPSDTDTFYALMTGLRRTFSPYTRFRPMCRPGADTDTMWRE